MSAEPLTGHRCPTCKTKNKSWIDAETQQITCEECGQASLVLITPDPVPAKPARRTRKSTTRGAAK